MTTFEEAYIIAVNETKKEPYAPHTIICGASEANNGWFFRSTDKRIPPNTSTGIPLEFYVCEKTGEVKPLRDGIGEYDKYSVESSHYEPKEYPLPPNPPQ